jgi:hypothetical protein
MFKVKKSIQLIDDFPRGHSPAFSHLSQVCLETVGKIQNPTRQNNSKSTTILQEKPVISKYSPASGGKNHAGYITTIVRLNCP